MPGTIPLPLQTMSSEPRCTSFCNRLVWCLCWGWHERSHQHQRRAAGGVGEPLHAQLHQRWGLRPVPWQVTRRANRWAEVRDSHKCWQRTQDVYCLIKRASSSLVPEESLVDQQHLILYIRLTLQSLERWTHGRDRKHISASARSSASCSRSQEM